jgi:uncharacterized damage-inducible protein DinB
MTDATAPIRHLYDYHWWANRRLFEVAFALGEETCRRDVGKQFSFPTLKGMLAHVYGADRIWFDRFAGAPPRRLPNDSDFASMADLRARWDDLEKTQRTFLERLTPAELSRTIEYTSALFQNRPLALPLGGLLQHVANHATHHRSEAATMLTMLSGSPPGTDFVVYQLITAGQIAPEDAGWR